MQNRVINDTSKTISTTSIVISQAVYGSERVIITLANTSLAGETISLAWGKDAIAGQGIVLKQGQTISFSKDAGYTPSDQQLNAIASVATATLAIHEEINIGEGY